MVKDFLGNEIEAGNTIAYSIDKDTLVLFKVIEVLPTRQMKAIRLDNNPENKVSKLGGDWRDPKYSHRGHYLSQEIYANCVKLWLTFEEGKK
jgi:hypothetical protein